MLSSCQGADGEDAKPTSPRTTQATPSPTPQATPIREYVALGDSFTAAPWVPQTDVAQGCLRSDGNYPSLLNKALKPKKFRDVSCVSATTGDMTKRQQTFRGMSAPPQLNALTPTTDLVTLGIGGNDGNLYLGTISRCTTATDQSVHSRPTRIQAKTCDPGTKERADQVLPTIKPSVVTVVKQIKQKAPKAKVVVVGYPRLTSPGVKCQQLPLNSADTAMMTDLVRRLDRELAAAARASGATYIDMFKASNGHAVCDKDPWVNGLITDTARAMSLHPFAAGQEAVAARVKSAIGH